MTIAGFALEEYDPKREASSEKFWLGLLGQIGFRGPGHIFVVSADQIDPTLGVYGTYQGLGYEELSKLFTEDLYAKFGETGDPAILGNLIVAANIGMNNTYNQ
jgi:hypothetical protein